MIKVQKTASLLLLLLFACIKSYFYDFEVNGIYYGYNSDSQTAYVTNGDQQYSGSVMIPASVTFNGRTLNEVKRRFTDVTAWNPSVYPIVLRE